MGVDSYVAGDGEQPRPHRSTLLVQRLGMPPGPQQSLLYDVLRSTAVTGGEAQGVGHQRRRMLIEERAHSRVLGRSHCDHHITVTHPAPHRFSADPSSQLTNVIIFGGNVNGTGGFGPK